MFPIFLLFCVWSVNGWLIQNIEDTDVKSLDSKLCDGIIDQKLLFGTVSIVTYEKGLQLYYPKSITVYKDTADKHVLYLYSTPEADFNLAFGFPVNTHSIWDPSDLLEFDEMADEDDERLVEDSSYPLYNSDWWDWYYTHENDSTCNAHTKDSEGGQWTKKDFPERLHSSIDFDSSLSNTHLNNFCLRLKCEVDAGFKIEIRQIPSKESLLDSIRHYKPLTLNKLSILAHSTTNYISLSDTFVLQARVKRGPIKEFWKSLKLCMAPNGGILLHGCSTGRSYNTHIRNIRESLNLKKAQVLLIPKVESEHDFDSQSVIKNLREMFPSIYVFGHAIDTDGLEIVPDYRKSDNDLCIYTSEYTYKSMYGFAKDVPTVYGNRGMRKCKYIETIDDPEYVEIDAQYLMCLGHCRSYEDDTTSCSGFNGIDGFQTSFTTLLGYCSYNGVARVRSVCIFRSTRNQNAILKNKFADPIDVRGAQQFVLNTATISLSDSHNSFLRIGRYYSPSLLRFQTQEQTNNRENVALVIKKISARELQFASRELKNDKKIVELAIQQCWKSLLFASNNLKSDPEVVMQAIRINPKALLFATPILLNDRQFVLDALKENANVFIYLPTDLKNIYEFAFQAISSNWEVGFDMVNEYTEIDFFSDYHFMAAAVAQNVLALGFSNVTDVTAEDNLVKLAFVNHKHTENFKYLPLLVSGRLKSSATFMKSFENIYPFDMGNLFREYLYFNNLEKIFEVRITPCYRAFLDANIEETEEECKSNNCVWCTEGKFNWYNRLSNCGDSKEDCIDDHEFKQRKLVEKERFEYEQRKLADEEQKQKEKDNWDKCIALLMEKMFEMKLF